MHKMRSTGVLCFWHVNSVPEAFS